MSDSATQSSQHRISGWRVFPYDNTATPGAAFTPEYVGGLQGSGRFDIPDLSAVLYLAETPEHAIAEVIQQLRNQSLDDSDLVRFGHRLALVAATLTIPRGDDLIPDLCDAAALARHSIRPGVLASWDFTQTQAISRQLFGAERWGFRWWSALSGDWHTVVLFHAKLSAGALQFGMPMPLSLQNEAVLQTAQRLAIRVST